LILSAARERCIVSSVFITERSVPEQLHDPLTGDSLWSFFILVLATTLKMFRYQWNGIVAIFCPNTMKQEVEADQGWEY